jgi:hypothetical protein
MKSWFASKTIIVNVLLAVLGVIGEVSQVFPVSEHPKLWVSVTAVINIVLRLITNTGISK